MTGRPRQLVALTRTLRVAWSEVRAEANRSVLRYNAPKASRGTVRSKRRERRVSQIGKTTRATVSLGREMAVPRV